mgnify:CR=1 FL=1
MSMREQISLMPAQFHWEPTYERENKLSKDSLQNVFLCGMGGSHLGADLLLREAPALPLTVRHEYSLPIIPEEQLAHTLVIVSSYSGETEEALDVLHTALQENIPCAAITSGGTLLAQARDAGIPTIIFPKDGVEPRMTLGYALRALTKLLNEEELFANIKKSGEELSTDTREKEGASLADIFAHKIPVFYTSTRNVAVGYILKITLNETAKIPAFANTIPEACHNELSGYDAVASSKEIIHTLLPVFVTDEKDHPRIRARMRLMREIFTKREISSCEMAIAPQLSSLAGAIEVIQTGTSVAVELAKRDGVPDAHTPIIDDFKQRLAKIPW